MLSLGQKESKIFSTGGICGVIDQKILKRVKRELKRIDSAYELEYVCHLNNIKADNYLYLVIAEDTAPHELIPKEYRYVTYTYNDSFGDLYCGHYNLTLEQALATIANLRKDYN